MRHHDLALSPSLHPRRELNVLSMRCGHRRDRNLNERRDTSHGRESQRVTSVFTTITSFSRSGDSNNYIIWHVRYIPSFFPSPNPLSGAECVQQQRSIPFCSCLTSPSRLFFLFFFSARFMLSFTRLSAALAVLAPALSAYASNILVLVGPGNQARFTNAVMNFR